MSEPLLGDSGAGPALAYPVPADYAERMIEGICGIAEIEPEGDHFTSHVLFIRKVLREPYSDAFAMAHAFRHVKLTPEKCHKVALGWTDA